MKSSNTKMAFLIAATPLLLAGVIILLHDMTDRIIPHEIADLILLFCGFFLSILFYLYIKHLSQTTKRMLAAITSFRTDGQAENISLERDDDLGRLGSVVEEILQEEKEHIRALELSEGKLSALFETVGEGIIITDDSGRIEDVNPGLCKMLGYEAGELVGQNVSMMMPLPYAQHHDRYMQEAVDSENVGFMGMYRDLTALRKDGSSVPVELNLDRLRISGRNLFAATMRDVSEQRGYERQLLNAKLKAEIANQAKTHFLSMMSHEIRTPLHGVMGTLELLESEVPAGARELIEVANHSASNLMHIVDDILDVAKAESGHMELESARFDLLNLLEECLVLYLGKAREQGLVLEFGHVKLLSTKVFGDAYRLRQMVNNLLGNALKFTVMGKVILSLDWHELDEEQLKVFISVEDSGIGIAAEKQKRVFDAFIQGDSSIRREYGGTGLGLSIVKYIAQLMGGDIELESEEGRGSRFTIHITLQRTSELLGAEINGLQGKEVACIDVTDELVSNYLQVHGIKQRHISRQHLLAELEEKGLISDVYICGQADENLAEQLNHWLTKATSDHFFLLLCAEEAPWQMSLDERILCIHKPILHLSLDSVFRCLYDSPQIPDVPASIPGGRMKKILLVEDNPVNQEVSREILQHLGLQVEIAENGIEAVNAVCKRKYDLIFMDCQMPEMDGFQATTEIRRMESEKDRPKHNIVALTANAMKGDREKCLAVGMNDYLTKPYTHETIINTLKRWLPAQNWQREKHKSETITDTLKNGTKMESDIVDYDIANGLKAILKDRFGIMIDKFEANAEKLINEMHEAYSAKDMETLRRGAHTLKGSGGTLGAKKLQQACLELESSAQQAEPSQLKEQLAEVEAEYRKFKQHLPQLKDIQ